MNGKINRRLFIVCNACNQNKSTRNKLLKIGFSAFKAAALQGYLLGQHIVAMCYSKGQGVKKNEKLEIDYLHLAADQGEPDACEYLSRKYSEGEGVEMNIDKAIHYLEKAKVSDSYSSKQLEILKKRRLEDAQNPPAKRQKVD